MKNFIKKVGKFIKECFIDFDRMWCEFFHLNHFPSYYSRILYVAERRSGFSEWKCSKCDRKWITDAYHINHKGEFE